jgi:Zn-dependent protease
MKLLFLLLKSAKFGKLFTTTGTMLLSLGAYALIFGWRYAAGFIGLIFMHEMGHYLAAKQRGLDVGAPTFIPFVGAWIELKDIPHDVETEAYVGIAGPVIGSGAALALYFLAGAWNSNMLLALAYAGFMINLFNLIPLSPLDGGRVTAIISPRVWLFGVPILIGIFFIHPSPILILIAVIAAPHVYKVLRGTAVTEQPEGYYDVPAKVRVEYACWYLALTALLAVMSFEVHQQLGARIG